MYTFRHNNEDFRLELQPFQLNLISNTRGMVTAFSLESYPDCFLYLNGLLYVSTRHGEFLCFDLNDQLPVFRKFTCDESYNCYQTGISLYPHTLPRLIKTKQLGDYDYLPELHTMNAIVAKNAITVFLAYKHYILISDQSGRISVFDTVLKETVRVLRVQGAISKMTVSDGVLTVKHIADQYFPDPKYLNSADATQQSVFILNF